MTRFILYAASAIMLTFASCTKDATTPDNCVETLVAGTFINVSGTAQANGQLAGNDLSDAERSLELVGTSCNVLKVKVGATLGGFEAECAQNGNTISGNSTNNVNAFSYNTTTKQITVSYTAPDGIKYTIVAKK